MRNGGSIADGTGTTRPSISAAQAADIRCSASVAALPWSGAATCAARADCDILRGTDLGRRHEAAPLTAGTATAAHPHLSGSTITTAATATATATFQDRTFGPWGRRPDETAGGAENLLADDDAAAAGHQ